jgi:hypothetical protein
MKICIEKEDKDIGVVQRQAGHIYKDLQPMYKGRPRYFICIKHNHADKWHLHSLETGLCQLSEPGVKLDPLRWEDVTDKVKLVKGDCNDY